MKLYRKKGKAGKYYQEATVSEIFREALEIMRNHPRLRNIAQTIEDDMIFGYVTFPSKGGGPEDKGTSRGS